MTTPPPDQTSPPGGRRRFLRTHPAHISPLRHYGGFLLAGLTALGVDALILTLLTDHLGLTPFLGRLLSMALAMVVSWQINRRVTFAIHIAPTWAEFTRFAVVSWAAQAFNYAVFAVILLVDPSLWPVWALIAASAIAMFSSYTGYRFGVFPRP